MRCKYTIEGTKTPLDDKRAGWRAPHTDWMGDLYGGMPQVIPPILWWATGSSTVSLVTFGLVSVLTVWSTWRFMSRMVTIVRWII